MMKCSQRHKLLFGFFKIKDKHRFIITNAFYTLEDKNIIDIIRTCEDCDFKDALSLDQETLLESIQRYPNAFRSILRDYLKTWMR